jgi:hypothetical protein
MTPTSLKQMCAHDQDRIGSNKLNLLLGEKIITSPIAIPRNSSVLELKKNFGAIGWYLDPYSLSTENR